MPVSKETTLIEKLLRKDMDAFSLLYDIYAPAIYGIILRKINNEEKAHEVLANVFIHFSNELKNKDSLKEGLFVCLYRITDKMICNCLS